MKTTKYFLSMAALALVGAMTVSCSSDDNITDQPQQLETPKNTVTLTTTIGFDDADGTRALDIDYSAHTLTKTFAVGDQIALIYTQTGSTTAKAVSAALTAGDISADGKSANFTFELTDPKSGIVRYIYPAALAGATGVDYSKLASQDGTLASIASTLDYAGVTKVWSGDALPTANLTNQFAIIAYTLKDATGANDITSTITGMTISDGMNNYTINGVDPDGHIYAAIRIMNDANIEYTATDGTKNYTKSVTGKSYTPGEFYQVGLRMAEAAPARTLAEATAEDLGKIAGADGNIYDSKDAASTAGTTAVAMIAYVGSSTDHATYTHGLAIALADESNSNWFTAKSTCEGKIAVTNAAWLLPSQNQWKAMFSANGGNEENYSGLNTALATAGGTALQGGYYWSSSESDEARAYRVELDGGSAYFLLGGKYVDYLVRSCLAF